MVIFLRDRVPYVLVFAVFLVFYRQLGANVDRFQLNFVVDFIPSYDACCLSSSLELSEGSSRYLVDFHSLFGRPALDLLVPGGIGAPESLFSLFAIVQLIYFL